ncbi:MAG TPA: NUDIX hydrolase [Streptosporangiaceae bacterium]|jgi:ADP-ribose pyrophosphatase
MTSPDASRAEPGSMKDAQLIEAEIILPKPKRFVRETLAMPDGNKIDWYYIDTPASVMILPVTASGTVVLVRQYRHNLKSHTLELPAGTLNKGEDPEQAAIREMEEETGFAMASGVGLRFLGRYYSLPSETNRYTYFFLAQPVIPTGSARGDTEIEKYFDMSVAEVPVDGVFDAIGDTIDGIETVGALMLARKHIQP